MSTPIPIPVTVVGCFTKNGSVHFVLSNGVILQEIDKGSDLMYVDTGKKIPTYPTHELKEIERGTGTFTTVMEDDAVSFEVDEKAFSSCGIHKDTGNTLIDGMDGSTYYIPMHRAGLNRAGRWTHKTLASGQLVKIYEFKGYKTKQVADKVTIKDYVKIG